MFVACKVCGHVAYFLASDVAQFVNPTREIEALPFRCGECGGMDCAVKASEYDRDRRPDIVVRELELDKLILKESLDFLELKA